MIYSVAETFYSLQGEGEWTGCAAFFIRLAGCNLNCSFCDTDYKPTREATVEELVEEALKYPARKVIITGGEPCLQDTQPLVIALRNEGFKCHLETNGTLDTHYDWDWIAVSPKPPLRLLAETIHKANEVKFLCGFPGWKEYMETVMNLYRFHPVKADAPVVWLMPRDYHGLLQHNIGEAVKYCLDHPRVKLCVQMHKCIGIR